MDEAEKNDLGEVQGLPLIDVSSVDDWLLDSSSNGLYQPHQSTENQKEHKSFEFLEAVDAYRVDSRAEIFGQREELAQPYESLEPERAGRIGKCNLRKSLAWDSAFFTSAGVLDPEELSSMIEGVKSTEKHSLPRIQEDSRQSTDSISTLESDSLTLESIEADLFEDIRASIQKSSKASTSVNSNGKSRSGETESQPLCSTKKVDLFSRNRLQVKAKPVSKKLSSGIQGSEKAIKKGSVCPQVKQPIAKSREPTSSLPKPPKVLGRVNSIPTGQTKRASLGVGQAKVENDNAKGVTGRGAPVSKIPGLSDSHSIVPRLKLSSRSASVGSSIKTEPTTSCSSIDSSGSASSDNIGKSPLNSQSRKIDSKSANLPSSGSKPRIPSRTAVRHKTQPGNSNLSAYLKSRSKPCSSMSPASSISEWSSESSSSTSTVNQRSNNSKASLDDISPCRGISIENDALQASDYQKNSNDQFSDGHQNLVAGLSSQNVKKASTERGILACPASTKPSGLRMPSPKIGFFDGVKPTGRTPKGDMQSHSALPTGLTKIAPAICSPIGGSNSNKAKLGKLQAARTVMATGNIKLDIQQTTLNVKPASVIPVQDSSTASTKFSAALRNVEYCPGISSKVKSEVSPKTRGESCLKAERGSTGGLDTAKYVSDTDLNAEENGCEGALKGKMRNEMRTENGRHAHLDDIKSTHIKADGPTCESGSDCTIESINTSQKVDEGAIYGLQPLKNNFHPLCKTNDKEKTHFDDQIEGLSRLVEAVDLKIETQKEITGNSLSKSDVKCPDNIGAPELSCSGELLVYGQKESLNIFSKATSLTLSPTTFEITPATRVPFAVKNLFCNSNGLLDFSEGSTVDEVEKPITLSSLESAQKENA